MLDLHAYIRYSPRPKKKASNGEDTLANSVYIQQTRIERTAASIYPGANIIWYKDVMVSARLTPLNERTEGEKLCRAIEQGARHVIVSSLDRLFRNVVDGIQTLEEWKDRGVRLTLCDGVSVDLGTADGRFVAVLLLGTAEREPFKTAERTSQAHKASQLQNKRVGRHPRLGYRFDEDSVNPDTGLPDLEVVDEQEMQCCRKMIELHKEGYSLNKISRILNSQWEPLKHRPNKKKWYPSDVQTVVERDG